MDQLTDQQLSQLVGQGECFIHFHPKDPYGLADRLGLMAAEPVTTVTGDHTLSGREELILVDTTAQSITVTLPVAAKGREYQIVKVSSKNALYIIPANPDTVCGGTSGLVVYNAYTSLHLKAITGGYILI